MFALSAMMPFHIEILAEPNSTFKIPSFPTVAYLSKVDRSIKITLLLGDPSVVCMVMSRFTTLGAINGLYSYNSVVTDEWYKDVEKN
jgi:hypothetical protein